MTQGRFTTAVTDIIKLMFVGATSGRRPTVFEVADQMNLPLRTLQRRLKSEETNFSDIMSDVIAEALLEKRKYILTVGELADTTGFTDRTGLTNFCRTRFGCNARDLIAFKVPGKDEFTAG